MSMELDLLCDEDTSFSTDRGDQDDLKLPTPTYYTQVNVHQDFDDALESLLRREAEAPFPNDYFARHADFDWDQQTRMDLLHWMYNRFDFYNQQTLYTAAVNFDRFVSCQIVPKRHLHAVLTVSVMLAAKLHESKHLSPTDYCNEIRYKESTLIEIERQMLQALQFQPLIVTPHEFIAELTAQFPLRDNTEAFAAAAYCAADSSIQIFSTLKYAPSVIALGCCLAAMHHVSSDVDVCSWLTTACRSCYATFDSAVDLCGIITSDMSNRPSSRERMEATPDYDIPNAVAAPEASPALPRPVPYRPSSQVVPLPQPVPLQQLHP